MRRSCAPIRSTCGSAAPARAASTSIREAAEEVPEPQPAPEDAQLTDTDFLRAEIELAERHHNGHGAVRDLVMLTHQRAGLGYSEPERVAVINQVALAMGRGRAEVSDEQILALSGRAAPPSPFGYVGAMRLPCRRARPARPGRGGRPAVPARIRLMR